jgi:hypothetical protein
VIFKIFRFALPSRKRRTSTVPPAPRQEPVELLAA